MRMARAPSGLRSFIETEADMNIEKHAERIIAEWYGAFRRGGFEPLLELFAQDARFHDPRLPPLQGLAQIRAYYADLFAKTTAWEGTIEGRYVHGARALNER